MIRDVRRSMFPGHSGVSQRCNVSADQFPNWKKYRVSTQMQIGNLDSSRLLDCPEWTRKTGMKLDMHRPGSNSFFPLEVQSACTAQFAVRHCLQQCHVHIYKNSSCTTCNKEVPTVFHPWVEFCTVWQGKLKWSWTCNAQVFTLHIFRRQGYNCLFHDHELSGGILRGNKKAPPDRDETETMQNLSRAMSRSKKM